MGVGVQTIGCMNSIECQQSDCSSSVSVLESPQCASRNYLTTYHNGCIKITYTPSPLDSSDVKFKTATNETSGNGSGKHRRTSKPRQRWKWPSYHEAINGWPPSWQSNTDGSNYHPTSQDKKRLDCDRPSTNKKKAAEVDETLDKLSTPRLTNCGELNSMSSGAIPKARQKRLVAACFDRKTTREVDDHSEGTCSSGRVALNKNKRRIREVDETFYKSLTSRLTYGEDDLSSEARAEMILRGPQGDIGSPISPDRHYDAKQVHTTRKTKKIQNRRTMHAQKQAPKQNARFNNPSLHVSPTRKDQALPQRQQTENEDQAMYKLQQQMSHLDVGSADNQANQTTVKDRNTPNQNFDAFGRLLNDDDIPVPCEELIDDVARNEQLAPKGVVQGQPEDLIVLAEEFQQQQELGQHDGVLLDEGLVAVDSCYREGDQYIKLKLLGEGAYGSVFLIQDKISEKEFAGKYVPLKGFIPKEAILWCILNHPKIVRLCGLVRTNDEVLFLSKYETCQTLQELKNKRVVGQGEALYLTEQLFDALAYLHEKQIFHMDINRQSTSGMSPYGLHPFFKEKSYQSSSLLPGKTVENILWLKTGHICLIDFGCATKQLEQQESLGAVDVWSAILVLINIIGKKNAIKARIPPNTDKRLRNFIDLVMGPDLPRQTAAKVLKMWPRHLVDELYNIPAIAQDVRRLSPGDKYHPNQSPSFDLLRPPRGPPRDEYQSPSSDLSEGTSPSYRSNSINQPVPMVPIDIPDNNQDVLRPPRGPPRDEYQSPSSDQSDEDTSISDFFLL